MTKLAELASEYYKANIADWHKFRLVYEGGSAFINKYLHQFSAFEQNGDYLDRKAITYNPAYASSAVRQIKNSIFQRLVDVKREGGSDSYQKAVKKDVDRKNRSMNAFLGECVLPDLLSISKIGVYVDMPVIQPGASIADTSDARPYIYTYSAENILNGEEDGSFAPGRFKSLLLCEHIPKYDETYGLPCGTEQQYRLFKKLDGGGVGVWVYDKDDKLIGTANLTINEIPFVLFDIDESLLKDVADYQIAGLQLASGDVNFLFKSNFPIYTEQEDPKWANQLRVAPPTGTGIAEQARSGIPNDSTVAARVTREFIQETEQPHEGSMVAGLGRGRRYIKGAERPGFIHPSSEPVRASMDKQKEMAQEVRAIVDLALSSMAAKYASGESKKIDQLGLEAGLSYIGLVCQRGEQEIARIWSLYEKSTAAQIEYPTNYSLRNDKDREEEAERLTDLSGACASKTYSKYMQKRIATTLMSMHEDLDKVISEIEAAKGPTSDSETLKQDSEAGFVSKETAAELRGYDPSEAKKAEDDHERRARRIAQAQAEAGQPDMADQGATQKEQKEGSRDPTMMDSTKERVRGVGLS